VSVAIVEQADFASFTSQESSNLVWGGFRYLENYELPLVVKLSRSRNRLMRAYPSVIAELRFLATLDASAPFPSWLAALGTVGYWGLGQFATKPPQYHRPNRIKAMEPIIRTDTAEAAIEYGDAYLKDNDARFVWGFVRSAIDHGSTTSPSTRPSGLMATGGPWYETPGPARISRWRPA
jgi:glycerol-3-phosphate dehydrogenase